MHGSLARPYRCRKPPSPLPWPCRYVLLRGRKRFRLYPPQVGSTWPPAVDRICPGQQARIEPHSPASALPEAEQTASCLSTAGMPSVARMWRVRASNPGRFSIVHPCLEGALPLQGCFSVEGDSAASVSAYAAPFSTPPLPLLTAALLQAAKQMYTVGKVAKIHPNGRIVFKGQVGAPAWGLRSRSASLSLRLQASCSWILAGPRLLRQLCTCCKGAAQRWGGWAGQSRAHCAAGHASSGVGCTHCILDVALDTPCPHDCRAS